MLGPSGSDRRPALGAPSPGDEAIARQNAQDALRRYRQQQAEGTAPQGTPGGGTSGSPSFLSPSRRGFDGWSGAGSWFAGRGWTPPPFAYSAPSSFGPWNALFLWFLLDTLSRPGHAQFFHDQQNQPGYNEWRQEADRQAQSNPELRRKLDDLDRELATKQGQPRDPDRLPPDTPAEVAVATSAIAPRTGFDIGGIVFVLLGGGVLFLLWRARRRAAGPGGPPTTATGGALSQGLDMVRRRVTGATYTPSLFRVGMVVSLDPAPFVLAAGASKVPVPQAAGGTVRASVSAVGTLSDGVELHRLYLDERSLFQLHLDKGGRPDECRYFGRIDEVRPADEAEWGFWLDPDNGVIGWPVFETKDGKSYTRVWASGDARVPPRRFTERLQDAQGVRTRGIQAMLYAAPLGRPPPAPQTEYILVAMVEAGGEAWIEIAAGIDINPAMLSLA